MQEERVRRRLAAIMAAVVGVIANLSVWFAAHVFFAHVDRATLGPLSLITPDMASFRPGLAALALMSGWLLLRRHWSLPLVLLVAAAGGLALHFAAPYLPAAS